MAATCMITTCDEYINGSCVNTFYIFISCGNNYTGRLNSVV